MAHQTHAPPAPCSAAPTFHLLGAPLRLGPSAQIFCSFPHSRSVALRLGPSATEEQSQARRQRRRLRLSPVASCPHHRPPHTGRRPCVRTSLSPPVSAVPWEPGQLPRVAGPWLRWLCTFSGSTPMSQLNSSPDSSFAESYMEVSQN